MHAATALALVTAAWLVNLSPVAAATTTSGGGFFTGTVTLQVLPCYNGGCGGTVAGTAGLSLSGIGTATIGGTPISLPYTAAWAPTVSSLSAGFNYQDVCELGQPDGTVPISGSGTGTFTLSGGVVALGGGTITSAVLTGGFAFMRIGDAVHLNFDNLTITPPSGSPVIAVELSAAIVGQSAAGLVWTNGPGTCGNASNEVSNQTAEILGLELQPA